MNEEEKKLEEIRSTVWDHGIGCSCQVCFLLAQLAEKDREIERWKKRTELLRVIGKEMYVAITEIDWDSSLGYDAGPINDDLNRWTAALEDEG